MAASRYDSQRGEPESQIEFGRDSRSIRVGTGQGVPPRRKRGELWIAVSLVFVAVAAAMVEHGRDMAVAVLAVILGLAIHVRLFLNLGELISRLRGPLLGRELKMCGGLCAGALLLHWLSPVPLGRVAALSAVIATLALLANRVLSRTVG